MRGAHRWLNDLFKLGLKRPIVEGDIYESLKSHDSKRMTDELTAVWHKEKKTKVRPSFLHALWQIYAARVLLPSITYTVLDVFTR